MNEWILSSCVLLLLIMLVRFIFRRRVPPGMCYAMWLAAAFRLLIPISLLETPVSVLNFLTVQEKGEENPAGELTENLQGKEVKLYLAPGLERITDIVQIRQSREKEPETKNEIGRAAGAGRSGERRKNRTFSGRDILLTCYLTGAVSGGMILFLVNLSFGRRLRRSRRRITDCVPADAPAIPVYVSKVAQTPCLSGLMHPAVYITEDVMADEKTLAFVLCHEGIHYHHHDNWWAVVRVVCLCLHWYNPLVWLAARWSRQDGEIACDRKVLEVFGQETCVDYGRTLLWISAGKLRGISGWNIFTAIVGNKRQLKERLQMIVNNPGTMAGRKALLVILMTAICLFTFTGRIPPDMSLAAENPEDGERAAGAEHSGFYREEIPDGEINGTYKMAMEREEEKGELSNPSVREGDVLVLDLNFDGWDDLCYRDGNASGVNIPYYCMLWNQQTRRYEYSAMLYNVETDRENQWISCQVREGEGRYCTTFYRYDADNRLHMVRYKEEYLSGDKLVNQLDLTYVDDNGIYTLPAIVDEENLHLKMIAMARETLLEINNWTGSEVDTACFQVTNMGSVFLALSAADMEHSRVFGCRSFGADTEYNLSGYEKSISSIGVASGRNVWFSPVLWRFLPENMDIMTDEEVIIWYFERLPVENAGKVKTITQRQEDMWTIQTREGKWFEVVYSPALREIYDVVGPYPSYPEH